MRNLLFNISKAIVLAAIIWCCILFSGCYTKKKALEKFCNSSDTTIVIHDTIVTETIHSDTVFSASIDTMTITNDRLVITYKKIHDSIYLSGDCIGDTIYKTTYVPFAVKCPKVEFTWWQWLKFGWVVLASLFTVLVLLIVFKR